MKSFVIFVLGTFLWVISAEGQEGFDALAWQRPVDNPVFTTEYGNNHDAVLFVEPGAEFPYYLIASHTSKRAQLWRSRKFSWDSKDWELVEKNYQIGKFYEYDDGVKVGDTYFVYEGGKVFTYSGDLADSSGKWVVSGNFPRKKCDDIGVFYEEGVFHIFGEYGDFPHGADGTSLSHFTSKTGLGDWTLINTKAVDANPEGGNRYGVGDATIVKIDKTYFLFCDRESKGSPYKVVAWKSSDLNQPFEYLGKAAMPRSKEKDDWDNHRVQDAEIAYVAELGGFVMFCNMMDKDGDPGGDFPTLKKKETRVIGCFYHEGVMKNLRGE